MKLHTEQRVVERSNDSPEQEFTIKATAKAFGILSSGLYSDKILAIIRELSCNAYDSHIAAGKKATPIEIKLPTTLDPTFHVRDFGLGLDHQGVTKLYTTYFESTKADSNDFIGALGLGSKSPFSYVSTFTVTAIHNKMKRLYTAFINESGVPSIKKLAEEATNECNGVTVSLAVKRDDADKFKQSAKRALMYFDVQPKVIGGGADFKPFDLKHTVTGTNWKLRNSDYYAFMSGAYVVQGVVAYPVDQDILSEHGLSETGRLIIGQNIDMFVKVGDVEVAASREALSYTKATIANLIKIVETAAKEMRVSIQREFDAAPTLWDAQLLAASYGSGHNKAHVLYDTLAEDKEFTYKGKSIDEDIVVDLTPVRNTTVMIQSLSRYRGRGKAGNKVRTAGQWDPSKPTKSFELRVRNGMQVVVDDAHLGRSGMAAYFDTARGTVQDDFYTIVIRSVTKKVQVASEINHIIKGLTIDANAVVYTSKLGLTVEKTKYTYRAKKLDEALQWNGFPKNGGYKRDELRRVFSRLCWTGVKIDPQDEGYYVALDRFTIKHNGRDQESFDSILEAGQLFGLVKKDTPIIGVTEKQEKALGKKWVNVIDYINDGFKLHDKNGGLTAKVVAARVMMGIGDGVVRHIVSKWDEIEPQLMDGMFKDAFTKIVNIRDSAKLTNLHESHIVRSAEVLPSGAAFMTGCKKEHEAAIDMFTKTMSKHAMLKLVDWSRVSAKDVDMIVEYVNYVGKP